jgi:hypothetical protein
MIGMQKLNFFETNDMFTHFSDLTNFKKIPKSYFKETAEFFCGIFLTCSPDSQGLELWETTAQMLALGSIKYDRKADDLPVISCTRTYALADNFRYCCERYTIEPPRPASNWLKFYHCIEGEGVYHYHEHSRSACHNTCKIFG